jgi:hypothetical protein
MELVAVSAEGFCCISGGFLVYAGFFEGCVHFLDDDGHFFLLFLVILSLIFGGFFLRFVDQIALDYREVMLYLPELLTKFPIFSVYRYLSIPGLYGFLFLDPVCVRT